VQAEALAVMVAVTADFVFNGWDLEFLPYYRILFGTYHGASVIMRRTFDWKLSNISLNTVILPHTP
jgi:hypothetical protein